MNPPPALPPQEYARRFRETCHREVIRDGFAEPCDRPAAYLSHDPEGGGEFPATFGFYPACDRHRLRGPLPLTLIARPELSDLRAVAAEIAAMGVAAC